LRLEQAAPPTDVRVFNDCELLEDRAPRRVTFGFSQCAVQPRGVHLVAVILGPDRIGRHVAA